MKLNRRGFLTTAATGGAAAGLGLLTGCTTTAPRETVGGGPDGVTPGDADADFKRHQARLRRLTPTPPLGWNSYVSYGCPRFEDAMANLEAMAAKLKPFGYEYFVLDSGWGQESEKDPAGIKPPQWRWHAMDEFGRLEPSHDRWQEGEFHQLIARTHELGLQFGLWMMRGIFRRAVKENRPIKGTPYRAQDIANTEDICGWRGCSYGVDMRKPGAQEFYDGIFEKLAAWKIDFVKYDDLVPFPREILAISRAIERCGRDIVLSLSPGDANVLDSPYYRHANAVRLTGDVWDDRGSIVKSFAAWKKFQGFGMPGCWPDLDMIPFGQLKQSRWCNFTRDQMRTFITQRALAASALMIGGALTTLDEFSLSLLTNRDMLACNQNGVTGHNVYENDGFEVWHTSHRDTPGKGWIGVFNRNGKQPVTVTLSHSDLGLRQLVHSGKEKQPFTVRDIWDSTEGLVDDGGYVADIPADGVKFIVYEIVS